MTNPDQPVRKLGVWLPVSTEVLMDAGLIPDTRPPQPRPSHRQRLRWWYQDHLSVRTIRARLARWLGPDAEDWC